ncbi:MAG TPA: SpoIIE family protein phosphatase [Blastocatellia bacterium]|nr:SpoIIE family protein phosphatase [Blastocatellia bacterium]
MLRWPWLVATFLLLMVMSVQAQTVLTADQLQNGQAVDLDKLGWKYSPNDDPRFADPQFDDSAWATLKDSTKPHESDSGWHGMGWFRLHLRVPAELSAISLNLELWHLGASEIYLGGIRRRQFGIVGKTLAEEHAYNPNAEPLGLVFQGATEHVIAVRYSNQQTANPNSFLTRWLEGMAPFLGSNFNIGGTGLRSRVSHLGARTNQGYYPTFNSFTYLVFQGAVFLSFGILHLLLFAFFSRQRSNLFSGLFLSGIALMALLLAILIKWHYGLTGFYAYWNLFSAVAVFQGVAWLTFLYTAFKPKFSGLVWLFLASASLLTIGSLLGWANFLESGGGIYILVISIEALRIAFGAIRQKRNGARIVGSAIFLWLVNNLQASLYPIFRFPESWLVVLDVISFYGLIFALTIYLAREYARTNETLEEQLVQVKQLSIEALEHEKVKAENDRRAKELEEARQLQLSMLPRKLPQLPHLDIAAYMRTATEVGGDYYDFHLGEDGTLTIAVGDATGHGLKASALVSSVKSLFVSLAYHPDIPHIFHRISTVLKEMKLRGLFMAMTMVKVNGHQLSVSIAGMPSVLIYRAASKTVEEIAIRALPLGGMTKYQYQQQELMMAAEDVIVLLSDGLPERFNADGEMLDYARIHQTLPAIAHHTSEQIINELVRLGDEWGAGRAQEDDMTFVVLRVRGEQARQ